MFNMMPKGQKKILIGYCLAMLLLTQFWQHSHRHHALLETLSALLGAFLPIGISVFAIKNNWAMGRTGVVDREENPLSFWLLVALGFGVGVYLLYRGVSGLASLV
jgi:hypothetical protein